MYLHDSLSGSESDCRKTLYNTLLSCCLLLVCLGYSSLVTAATRPACGLSDRYAGEDTLSDFDITVPLGIVVIDGADIDRFDFVSEEAAARNLLTDAVDETNIILTREAGICLDLFFTTRHTSRYPVGGGIPPVEYSIDCPLEYYGDPSGPCFSEYLSETLPDCLTAVPIIDEACLLGRPAGSKIDAAGTALVNNWQPAGGSSAVRFGSGQGYILVFANGVGNSSGLGGWSGTDPNVPISNIVWRTRVTNKITVARTIAHEAYHVFGRDRSHTDDPEFLMTQTGSGGFGTMLTPEQRVRFREGAETRSFNSEHLGWLDTIADVSRGQIDLQAGQLYIEDFGRNLRFAFSMADVFPAEGADVVYTALVDTDNDTDTGSTVAGIPGIEKRVNMNVTGSFPFAGSTATITDLGTAVVEVLDEPEPNQNVKQGEPFSLPLSEPVVVADTFIQSIPLALLDPSGTAMLFHLLATDDASGERDTASFLFRLSAEIIIADLAVESLEVLNVPEMPLVPSTHTVTVRANTINNGPDGPIDAELSHTVTAPTGTLADPATWDESLEALSAGAPATSQTATDISCVTPGRYTINVMANVAATDTSVSDPDPNNNVAEAMFDLVCSTPIQIMVSPDEDPNSVNPGRKGFLSVAVLTTPTFDALTVDPASILFADATVVVNRGGPVIEGEDSDSDGDIDLILKFSIPETSIVCGDTEVLLTGETFAGEPVLGTESIRTIGHICR